MSNFGWGGSSNTFNWGGNRGGLTELQALKLAYAQQQEQKAKGFSLWDRVRGGVGIFGDLISYILRPQWAITTGLYNVTDDDPSTSFGGGLWQGLRGDDPKNTADIFSNLGWEGDAWWNRLARGTVGFVGDVVLDPITYATFGAGTLVTVPAKGAAKGALTLAPKLTRALGGDLGAFEAGAKVTRWGSKGLTTAPEEYAQIGKLLREAGPQYKARAFAAETLGSVGKVDNILPDSFWGKTKTAALDAARKEEASQIAKLGLNRLQIGYKLPFGPKWNLLQTNLKTPTGLRKYAVSPTFEKGMNPLDFEHVGWKQNRVLSPAARGFANMFRPDWLSPVERTYRMHARHIGRVNTDEARHMLNDIWNHVYSLERQNPLEHPLFAETPAALKAVREGLGEGFEQSIRFDPVLQIPDVAAMTLDVVRRNKGAVLNTAGRMRLRDIAAEYKLLKTGAKLNEGQYPKLDLEVLADLWKRGVISTDEVDGLARLWQLGKQMFDVDFAHGIKYKEAGRSPEFLALEKGHLYIPEPHLPKGRGTGVSTKTSLAPYQQARSASSRTEQLLARGYSQAELDPLYSFFTRARQGAVRQARVLETDWLTRTFGKPMYEADPVELKRVQDKIDNVTGILDDLGVYREGQRMDMKNYNKLISNERERLMNLKSTKKYIESREARIANPKTTDYTKKKLKGEIEAKKKEIRDRAKATIADPESKRSYEQLRDKARREIERRDKQLEKLEAKHKKARKGQSIAKDDPNYKFWKKVKNANHTGWLMAENKAGQEVPLIVNPEMSDTLTRMADQIVALSEDEFLRELNTTWGRFISRLKILYTVYNPGYRVRNTVSDWWAMWLSGIGPVKAAVSTFRGKQWLDDAHAIFEDMAKVRASYGTPEEYTKALNELLTPEKLELVDNLLFGAQWGILQGFFEADVNQLRNLLIKGKKLSQAEAGSLVDFMGRARASFQVAEDAGKLGKAAAGAASPFRFYGQWMGDFNTRVENWTRFGHFMERRRMGYSQADAGDIVRKFHFDYEDLSDFEQEYFKKMALFYSWVRKNLPMQLQAMAETPGRWAAFPKFALSMESVTDGEGDIIPDYLLRTGSFKMPLPGGDAYVIPPIGAADVRLVPWDQAAVAASFGLLPNQDGVGIGEVAQQWGEQIAPQWRVPFEVLTGRNLQTDAPITGTHPRNPVSGLTAATLGNIPILNQILNFGPTERKLGPDETIDDVGASPWVGYGASQVPISNLLVNQLSKTRVTQRGASPAYSWLAGLSAFRPDQEQQLAISNAVFTEDFDRMIRGLRDEDILEEPDVRDLSAYELAVQEMLRRLYGRPSYSTFGGY